MRGNSETLVAQSVEQSSPIVSQITKEVTPETKTFTDEEEEELVTSLLSSVEENSNDLDINLDLIRQCEKFLKKFEPVVRK